MYTTIGCYKHQDKLWSDLRKGNQKALSDLFGLYYRYLYNYGYKITPCDDLVKECIQEIFMTLWKSRSEINQADFVQSYLFISMRRAVFRRIRKKKALRKRNMAYMRLVHEEDCNIEELLISFESQKEAKRKLSEAIQILGKKQKEAIYLKFYEGMSSEEIASIMGIKNQSVYNHVSMGIQKLQEFMR